MLEVLGRTTVIQMKYPNRRTLYPTAAGSCPMRQEFLALPCMDPRWTFHIQSILSISIYPPGPSVTLGPAPSFGVSVRVGCSAVLRSGLLSLANLTHYDLVHAQDQHFGLSIWSSEAALADRPLRLPRVPHGKDPDSNGSPTRPISTGLKNAANASGKASRL